MSVLGPRNPDDYLLASERRVIRVRRHWATLLPRLGETVLFVAAALALFEVLADGGDTLWLLQSLVWYAAAAMVLRFAYHVLDWWAERIVVTDRRFMLTNGILVTNVAMMPISKVTDLTYKRPVLGRVLGYGTLIVESAGQIQALNQITYLPQPEDVYDAISELVFGAKDPAHSSASSRWPRREVYDD